jgi:hypothetical protein
MNVNNADADPFFNRFKIFGSMLCKLLFLMPLVYNISVIKARHCPFLYYTNSNFNKNNNYNKQERFFFFVVCWFRLHNA